MKPQEQLRQKIKDFAKKIQPVYHTLDWEWNGIGIPTSKDIENTLLRLVRSIKGKTTWASAGGLFAEKDEEYAEMPCVRFGFCSYEVLTDY